ncbi:hypothetical protein CBS101457_000376 [Exobasidium rhododendri]|nr:hypothetical protein CBS101457_000376 [Exobasidium rhododendri]
MYADRDVALDDPSSFTPKNREKQLPPSPKSTENDLHMDDSDDGTSSATMFHSPMMWTTTSRFESSAKDKPLPPIGDLSGEGQAKEEIVTPAIGMFGMEWNSPLSLLTMIHPSKREEYYDSPVSFGSPQDHYTAQSNFDLFDDSIRLSCSTLASSTTRTESDSSIATSPNGYGFAFGSPVRDSEQLAHESDAVNLIAVGLGLKSKDEAASDEQYAIVPDRSNVSGPFSHHRSPSWTMLSGNKLSTTSPAAVVVAAAAAESSKNTAAPAEVFSSSPLPFNVSVPPRCASRSRSSSTATSSSQQNNPHTGLRIKASKSSLVSSFSRNASADEKYQARPGTSRSMSTNSVTSSTTDSSFSKISPRTSSMKKTTKSTKSRQPSSNVPQHDETVSSRKRNNTIAVTGGLGEDIAGRGTSHQSKPAASNSGSGSSGSMSSRGEIGGSSSSSSVINKSSRQARLLPLSKDTSSSAKALYSTEILDDYLAMTIPDDFLTPKDRSTDQFSVALAEEGNESFLFGNGKSLQQIGSMLSSKTSHLLLAGCQDGDMLSFLEKALPVVSSHLLVLDVSNTGLTRLPGSILQCSKLEEVNISSNPFDRPWKNLGLGKFLLNLQSLTADDCQFTILPRDFGELQQLHVLSLERNSLTHLPSWLHRLKQLERLSLDGNPFQGAWRRICEAFTLSRQEGEEEEEEGGGGRGGGEEEQATRNLPRPGLGRNAISAPSRVLNFAPLPEEEASETTASSFEDESEEIEEAAEAPFTAALTDAEQLSMLSLSPGRGQEKQTRRPLIRRILTSSGDGGQKHGKLDGDTTATEQRRPSVGAESPEKKWGRVMRKLVKRPSNTSLTTLLISASADTSKCVSGGESGELDSARKAKITCPLTPVGWHDCTSDSPPGETTFATLMEASRGKGKGRGGDQKDIDQRRKLRALLQYLQDLDDLSASRVGPPGSVLPMDTSMAATRYSNPSNGNSHESGAETTTTTTTPSSSSSDHHPLPSSLCSTSSSSSDHAIGAVADANAPLCTSVAPLQGRDDAERRIRIVQEIIATEKSYIRGLQELVDIYVLPSAGLEDGSGNGQCAIPSPERRKVFGNVEAILHFHRGAFLPALESAARSVIDVDLSMWKSKVSEEGEGAEEEFKSMSANVVEQVAVVFQRHAAYFKMYSAYVNNVDAAQTRVAHWRSDKASGGVNNSSSSSSSNGNGNGNGKEGATPPSLVNGMVQQSIDASNVLTMKEKKRIKLFLQRARLDPNHSQLSLETYLHLPVQRIPRYRLLFEELKRNCPTYRLQDSSGLQSAYESILSIATLMNESKRQSENDRKLLEWQARIQGNFPSPLVQPHRRLIQDGDLLLKRIVMKTTAFHMSRTHMLEEESRESIDCDGAVTDTKFGIVQVDCLDQQCMEKKVMLLLCNDITIVVMMSKSKEPSSANASVELFAVLRIQGEVEIIGQTTLRVVDPKHILYFTASTPQEAVEWKKAMSSVHQQSRPTRP